jgi:hypothetical protein
VSAYCRLDDNDVDAGNEWSGAWAHSNPVDREAGTYSFELSRLLTTASSKTDAQLVAGATYQFGIAFWDPFQIEATGWTDSGHYITGCASNFIDLTLKASTGNGKEGKKGKKEGKTSTKGTKAKGVKKGSFIRDVFD